MERNETGEIKWVKKIQVKMKINFNENLDRRDLYADAEGFGGHVFDSRYLEPYDGGGGSGYVREYVRFIPSPDTIGYKIGDYVAKVIDAPIGYFKGLLRKLEGKHIGGAGDSC